MVTVSGLEFKFRLQVLDCESRAQVSLVNFRFQVLYFRFYISDLDCRFRFQVQMSGFRLQVWISEAWGIRLLKFGEPLGRSWGNPFGPPTAPGP